MLRRLLCLSPVLFCLICARSPVQAEEKTGFLEKTIQDEDGSVHRYVLYVPPGYDPDKRWPVILFLHGSGARGTDNRKPVREGLGPVVEANPSWFPSIIIFPQSESTSLIPLDGWMPTAPNGNRALAILDSVEKEYSTDPDRIYLTGLSMGGIGSWAHAIADPDRWAALVPICGGGNKNEAAKIAHLPIWCFHGSDDETVPVAFSRLMIDAIKEAGGKPYYTEYEGVGHNSWTQAYNERKLWVWLFKQRRGSTAE